MKRVTQNLKAQSKTKQKYVGHVCESAGYHRTWETFFDILPPRGIFIKVGVNIDPQDSIH